MILTVILKKQNLFLKKKGVATAKSKSDRTLGSGYVGAYVHGGRIGGIIELFCETDFVAKNEDFINLANSLAMHAIASGAEYAIESDIPEEEKSLMSKEDIDRLVMNNQAYLKDESKTIEKIIEDAIHKFGERIQIGRLAIFRI